MVLWLGAHHPKIYEDIWVDGECSGVFGECCPNAQQDVVTANESFPPNLLVCLLIIPSFNLRKRSQSSK